MVRGELKRICRYSIAVRWTIVAMADEEILVRETLNQSPIEYWKLPNASKKGKEGL